MRITCATEQKDLRLGKDYDSRLVAARGGGSYLNVRPYGKQYVLPVLT